MKSHKNDGNGADSVDSANSRRDLPAVDAPLLRADELSPGSPALPPPRERGAGKEHPPLTRARNQRGRPIGVKNGEGKRKRAVDVRDEQLKGLQQGVAMIMSVSGKRSEQIAEALGVSRRQASIILQEAKRSEIFQKARDWVGQQLMPKVLSNLEALLDQGDKETTLKLADTLALTSSGGNRHLAPWGAPAAPPPSADTPIEETFEALRFRYSSRPVAPADPTSVPRGPDGLLPGTLDAVVLEAGTASGSEGGS